MKKLLYILMAVAALTTVSCKKNDPKPDPSADPSAAPSEDPSGAPSVDPSSEDDEPSIEPSLLQPTYRIKSYTHSNDYYNYFYNADGTVSKVELGYKGEIYTVAVFKYEGKKLSITDEINEDAPLFDITLNDAGLAAEVINYGKGEKEAARTMKYEYDEDGFLIKATNAKNVVRTIQVISEEGNVEWWGRIGIAGEDGNVKDEDCWRHKVHTYYDADNIAGIHSEWAEDSEAKRWFYETGLLGRASVKVMKTAWWWGIADKEAGVVNDEWAAKLAYYPLDLDENGCIKVELKLYDTEEIYESDPDAMGEDDKYEFVCEKR